MNRKKISHPSSLYSFLEQSLDSLDLFLDAVPSTPKSTSSSSYKSTSSTPMLPKLSQHLDKRKSAPVRTPLRDIYGVGVTPNVLARDREISGNYVQSSAKYRSQKSQAAVYRDSAKHDDQARRLRSLSSSAVASIKKQKAPRDAMIMEEIDDAGRFPSAIRPQSYSFTPRSFMSYTPQQSPREIPPTPHHEERHATQYSSNPVTASSSARQPSPQILRQFSSSIRQTISNELDNNNPEQFRSSAQSPIFPLPPPRPSSNKHISSRQVSHSSSSRVSLVPRTPRTPRGTAIPPLASSQPVVSQPVSQPVIVSSGGDHVSVPHPPPLNSIRTSNESLLLSSKIRATVSEMEWKDMEEQEQERRKTIELEKSRRREEKESEERRFEQEKSAREKALMEREKLVAEQEALKLTQLAEEHLKKEEERKRKEAEEQKAKEEEQRKEEERKRKEELLRIAEEEEKNRVEEEKKRKEEEEERKRKEEEERKKKEEEKKKKEEERKKKKEEDLKKKEEEKKRKEEEKKRKKEEKEERKRQKEEEKKRKEEEKQRKREEERKRREEEKKRLEEEEEQKKQEELRKREEERGKKEEERRRKQEERRRREASEEEKERYEVELARAEEESLERGYQRPPFFKRSTTMDGNPDYPGTGGGGGVSQSSKYKTSNNSGHPNPSSGSYFQRYSDDDYSEWEDSPSRIRYMDGSSPKSLKSIENRRKLEIRDTVSLKKQQMEEERRREMAQRKRERDQMWTEVKKRREEEEEDLREYRGRGKGKGRKEKERKEKERKERERRERERRERDYRYSRKDNRKRDKGPERKRGGERERERYDHHSDEEKELSNHSYSHSLDGKEEEKREERRASVEREEDYSPEQEHEPASRNTTQKKEYEDEEDSDTYMGDDSPHRKYGVVSKYSGSKRTDRKPRGRHSSPPYRGSYKRSPSSHHGISSNRGKSSKNSIPQLIDSYDSPLPHPPSAPRSCGTGYRRPFVRSALEDVSFDDDVTTQTPSHTPSVRVDSLEYDYDGPIEYTYDEYTVE
ncbi:hypothetical protein ADUPG1_013278 [Aduncisulcus paluster]|uniref:Uncharacterized protein n=1 Tax=Aduncisulcus paluster TaxID=2918883 RepID=A0ABQ5K6I7_9EUKA|nr:hypothetical protein ADUPG1_013278 [Aduncisulcus paluster]